MGSLGSPTTTGRASAAAPASAEDARAQSAAPDALMRELAALHARQLATRDALARRNASDAEAAAAVDGTFARIPEYMEKLRRVQLSMDALAARTEGMRERCKRLSPEERVS